MKKLRFIALTALINVIKLFFFVTDAIVKYPRVANFFTGKTRNPSQKSGNKMTSTWVYSSLARECFENFDIRGRIS
jgi:hypothetical protein